MHKTIHLLLLSTVLLFLSVGCGDSRDKKDLAEIKAELKKIREEINAKDEAEKNNDPRKKLIDALSLLMEQNDESIKHDAINIIGRIGGSDAENILIKIIKPEVTDYESCSLAFSALSRVNKRKFDSILVELLEEGNEAQRLLAIGALKNHHLLDIPALNADLLKEVLEKYRKENHEECSCTDYENTLIAAIFHIDQSNEIDFFCNELSKGNRIQKDKLIYQLSFHDLSLRAEYFMKIVAIYGKADPKHISTVESFLRLAAKSADLRITDTLLQWQEIAKNNQDFAGRYINTLLKMKDPAAAKTLFDLCTLWNSLEYFSATLSTYPGIEKNEKDEFKLLDEEKMKTLLEEREKRIRELNELEDEKNMKKNIQQ